MNENSPITAFFGVKMGRPRKYEPEEFRQKADQYFQWCINNPMQKEEIVKYKDYYEKVNVSLLRVYTIERFCLFARINTSMFYEYEKKSDFTEVITYIRNTIYSQKFEGASSGFFKENLIIRDLKIKDTHEIEQSNRPIELTRKEIKMIAVDMKELYGPIPQKNEEIIDIDFEDVNES
jgi:hypothetical protein